MKAGTTSDYEEGAHKPEYETLAAFGSMCLNEDLESIIKLNDICNRYGLDTISAGATISFAIECYENGIISKKDTDGIELTWGNSEAIVNMTEKLARREGFGDVLADGTKIAAHKIGRGADKFAMQVQGQEVAMQVYSPAYPETGDGHNANSSSAVWLRSHQRVLHLVDNTCCNHHIGDTTKHLHSQAVFL